MTIIDTNRRTTAKLECLKSKGVSAIIRYYARSTKQPEKRVTRTEAEAIVGAGLKLGIVQQSGGAGPGSFSHDAGLKDAAYARDYGAKVIGQPGGSAIYFAVDYDASQGEVNKRIVPYFEGVVEAFSAPTGMPSYDVGAYGSGLVCRTLLDLGLAKYTWLSQSSGFTGTAEFKKSKRWTLLQQMPSQLCGLGVDADDLNGSTFGEFSSLNSIGAPVAGSTGTMLAAAEGGPSFVEFVSGLNLRHFKPYELLVMGDRHGDPHSPCHGLNMPPPRELWLNIVPTVRILDQLRDRLGAPIRITNAYRSPGYNKCIGGAKESQHTAFRALDFYAEGGSRPVDWANMLRSMRDTEKLFRGGVGLYSSFVHLDTRGTNADW